MQPEIGTSRRQRGPSLNVTELSGTDVFRPAPGRGWIAHSPPRARIRQRRDLQCNLTMPGVGVTVGEQIEALRAIAGDKVAARIREAPDATVAKIVSGWPTRFDAKRARDLGFVAERTFAEIIHAYIDDELGGRIAG